MDTNKPSLTTSDRQRLLIQAELDHIARLAAQADYPQLSLILDTLRRVARTLALPCLLLLPLVGCEWPFVAEAVSDSHRQRDDAIRCPLWGNDHRTNTCRQL